MSKLAELNFGFIFDKGTRGVYSKWVFEEDAKALRIGRSHSRLDFQIPRMSSLARFLGRPCDVYVNLDSTDFLSIMLHVVYRSMGKSVISVVAENKHYIKNGNIATSIASRMKKCLIYHFYKRSDFVIAESESAYRFLAQLGVAEAKMMMIPHGVDTSMFGSEMRSSNTTLTVLYAGGFVENKGFEYLLKALQTGELTEFKFIIISFGESKWEKEFQRFENVKLVPPVSHNEMIRLYQQSDIVLVPSIETQYDAERSPNVVIEAMAAGCIVIGTNVGGMSTYIGEGGIIIESRDEKAIISSLKRLKGAKSLVTTIREIGKKRVRQYFEMSRYAKDILNICYDLVSEKKNLHDHFISRAKDARS